VIRRATVLLAVLALACTWLSAATARPQASTSTTGLRAAQSFDGIAALSNCSAALVRWPSSRPRDAALVLTNGHCIGGGYLRAREVVVDRPSRRAVRLLDDDASVRVRLRTRRLIYATMFKTDVAVYSLRPTYRRLHNRYGVSALTVAARPAHVGSRLAVVSGYWKRTYRCSHNGLVHRLHEGRWDWWQSVRYSDDGCQIVGGTSGSPVLHPGGRRVLAVNNTLNEDGRRCARDNPCEESRRGRISVHHGRGYAQQTWWLTTCVRRDRSFDPDKRGCRLPS
jgi:hypothetical protein